MTRIARIVAPGLPHHGHERGNRAEKNSSSRGEFVSLGPNYQMGKSTRVGDVLEVALCPIHSRAIRYASAIWSGVILAVTSSRGLLCIITKFMRFGIFNIALGRRGDQTEPHVRLHVVLRHAEALQAAADRLSPEVICKRLDYWTLVHGPKFSKKESASFYVPLIDLGELLVLLEEGVLEVGAEDVLAVLDAVDDVGRLTRKVGPCSMLLKMK